MKTKSILPFIALATLMLLFVHCGGEEQMTTPDPKLDLKFKDAVTDYVKTSWGTWVNGESMGQCLIANAGSISNEAKEAVIKHGIEDAFNKLSGPHSQSLGTAWELCESKATAASTFPSIKTNSNPTAKPVIDQTPSDTPVLNFETGAGYQDFSKSLQAQFQNVVDDHFDAATEKAGISVAVYQGGYLWRYAKGTASSAATMTVGTPTLIRSTSKTFLAGLVLQQIDKGLYSLSDTLGSVLSDNKEYEGLDKNIINPNVTIEQMLTMTSGIQDVTDYFRPEITELQQSQNWKPVDIVNLVTNDSVEPGTYHIMAVILPQDAPPPNTARPYGDRSAWGGSGFGDITESSHHGADWYWATGKTTWAAAGMITTPENVARWVYELLSNQGSAISPTARLSLLDSFTGPLISIGGTEPEHQYGYHVTKTTIPLSGRSITAYGHPGAGGGYTSDVFYSPELDMSISILVTSHSDARSRSEAEGKISHRTLNNIAQQIFEANSH